MCEVKSYAKDTHIHTGRLKKHSTRTRARELCVKVRDLDSSIGACQGPGSLSPVVALGGVKALVA